MGEDAPWPFREKRGVVGPIGEQRRRERERFGVVADFVPRTPARTPRIEGIEDQIAAGGRVELGVYSVAGS